MSIPGLTDEVTAEILKIFGNKAGKSAEVSPIVEKALIAAMQDARERCIDVVHGCCSEDQDLAHKIAREIEQKEIALIANLSSMR